MPLQIMKLKIYQSKICFFFIFVTHGHFISPSSLIPPSWLSPPLSPDRVTSRKPCDLLRRHHPSPLCNGSEVAVVDPTCCCRSRAAPCRESPSPVPARATTILLPQQQQASCPPDLRSSSWIQLAAADLGCASRRGQEQKGEKKREQKSGSGKNPNNQILG